MNKISFTYVNW